MKRAHAAESKNRYDTKEGVSFQNSRVPVF